MKVPFEFKSPGAQDYGVKARSKFDVAGNLKSMAIMTLMTAMVTMEKINSFFAHTRSSDLLKPARAIHNQDRLIATATAR